MTVSAILPGQTIGVLGGGQLGRMMALAARRMGYRIVVLDPNPRCPTAQVSDGVVVGALDDREAAVLLAKQVDVITLDTEHVPAEILDELERHTAVRPGAAVLRTIQDRQTQKQFLDRLGVPQAAWAPVTSELDLRASLDRFGGQGIIKHRRAGYDGKGQMRVDKSRGRATRSAAAGGAEVDDKSRGRATRSAAAGGAEVDDKSRGRATRSAAAGGAEVDDKSRGRATRSAAAGGAEVDDKSRGRATRSAAAGGAEVDDKSRGRATRSAAAGGAEVDDKSRGRATRSAAAGGAEVDDKVSDASAAWGWLRGTDAVIEEIVPFAREISVVIARSVLGEIRSYPIAENVHRNHILHTTRAPAQLSTEAARQVADIALTIAEALGHIGVLAVEMFELPDGSLLVNEIAPRTHNSGHFTWGACATSQFEQHVRAVCGLRLADPRPLTGAVMVNLIGDLWAKGAPPWRLVLDRPDAHLHLYGKAAPAPGRKMGHVLLLDDDTDRALETAEQLIQSLTPT